MKGQQGLSRDGVAAFAQVQQRGSEELEGASAHRAAVLFVQHPPLTTFRKYIQTAKRCL